MPLTDAVAGPGGANLNDFPMFCTVLKTMHHI